MPEPVSKAPRAPAAPQQIRAVPAATPTGRVVSIDALRGFDMFWIIGGRELVLAALLLFPKPLPEWASQLRRQFEHSNWEGFTFYD